MMRAPLMAEECLAEQFGHYAAQWAAEQGASVQVAATVGRAAAALSLANSDGHVCVYLAELLVAVNAGLAQALTLETLRRSLDESHLVGSAAAPAVMPFVLDADDRFYLHRYFDYECRLARALAQRSAPSSAALPPAVTALPPAVTALLATLFMRDAAVPRQAVDWQQVAVVTALLGRLTLLSGGPGTGKTTAIVNLLACLLEENPACRIALAAPTGKASVRITEAIRLRAAHLPGRIGALLPQTAFTVHRLLGVLPEGGFVHGAGNLLPIDVLVVDEASMLDLALATHLFEAVPSTARVILVGDKDQLAAVESGAVFAELSADPRWSAARVGQLAQVCGVAPEVLTAPRPDAAPEPAAPDPAAPDLTDSVVWLHHNYRFGAESAIGRLAGAINAGDPVTVLAGLGDAPGSALRWIDDASVLPSPAALAAMSGGYVRYVEACRTAPFDPRTVTEAFGCFRVLCAVREGRRGSVTLNQRMGAFFRHALGDAPEAGGRSEWYPGRPVVVLRNDYPLRLFNGDIGIALPDAGGSLLVYFPDAEGGFRGLAPVRLPEHETAFAMTVHKAQGSEFDDVLIMLPATPNRVLTRELLYTGVTRAREHVTLVGSAEVIANAVRLVTRRRSGLSARLREALLARSGRP